MVISRWTPRQDEPQQLQTTETTVLKHDIASCFASMQFDNIIKCNRDQESFVSYFLVIPSNFWNYFFFSMSTNFRQCFEKKAFFKKMFYHYRYFPILTVLPLSAGNIKSLILDHLYLYVWLIQHSKLISAFLEGGGRKSSPPVFSASREIKGHISLVKVVISRWRGAGVTSHITTFASSLYISRCCCGHGMHSVDWL